MTYVPTQMATTGTLGDCSIAGRADAVTLPVDSLPPKQREAWLDVEAYRRCNPNATIEQVFKATGVSGFNYYTARKKMLATEKQAFDSFSDKDLIRPGEGVLRDYKPIKQRKKRKAPEAAPVEEQVHASEPSARDEIEVSPEVETITEADVLKNILDGLAMLEDNAARARILNCCQVFYDLERAR